jgi:hypothetical protein
MDNGSMKFTLGGGSYILIAIGTGLAISSWGTGVLGSIAAGLFWPATVSYWLLQVLHGFAT